MGKKEKRGGPEQQSAIVNQPVTLPQSHGNPSRHVQTHRWAEPSATHLRELMRQLVKDPEVRIPSTDPDPDPDPDLKPTPTLTIILATGPHLDSDHLCPGLAVSRKGGVAAQKPGRT